MPIPLPSMDYASLDWKRAFGIGRFNPDFDPKDLAEEVRRTLEADQHPQETAACVVSQAWINYEHAYFSLVLATNSLETAKQKMTDFLLIIPPVQTPHYKLTFNVLRRNLTLRKHYHREVQQNVDKLRIVLETAIVVTLSNVSYPQEQEPADEDRDAKLYGPYLHLVTDIPDSHVVPDEMPLNW